MSLFSSQKLWALFCLDLAWGTNLAKEPDFVGLAWKHSSDCTALGLGQVCAWQKPNVPTKKESLSPVPFQTLESLFKKHSKKTEQECSSQLFDWFLFNIIEELDILERAMVHFHSHPSSAACLCGVDGFAGSPFHRKGWSVQTQKPLGSSHTNTCRVTQQHGSCEPIMLPYAQQRVLLQPLPTLYTSACSWFDSPDSCWLSKDSNGISSSSYPFSSVSRQQLFHNLCLYSWQLFLGNCKLQIQVSI